VSRKPNPPRDDPEQSKRFIEIAREAEADSSKEEFDRAFKKVAKERIKDRQGSKGSRS
jgi:hypothetical protein